MDTWVLLHGRQEHSKRINKPTQTLLAHSMEFPAVHLVQNTVNISLITTAPTSRRLAEVILGRLDIAKDKRFSRSFHVVLVLAASFPLLSESLIKHTSSKSACESHLLRYGFTSVS